MAKLNVRTGTTIWRTYTLPDNEGQLGGYSGAAIWGSSPAIDVTRRLVFVGTGNLYTAPREVTQCQEAQNNQTTKPAQPDQCIGPDIHFDSILAIDIDTGRIKWSRKLSGYDVFYFACLVPNNPDCPPDLIWMQILERHPCCLPSLLTELDVTLQWLYKRVALPWL
jgi:outer membrane protein assembly factor BamB